MRFRKSIKICKGLKINLSKSGLSATVGGKGLSFNYGKKGGYLNASVPGTGLYTRNKILGGSKNRNKSYSSKNYNYSYNSYDDYDSTTRLFYLSIKEDSGEIVILNEDRIEITDETIINKIKRSELYKEKKKNYMQN